MSIKHMYYRLYQGVFRVAVNFLDWTPPKIISGPGSVKKLPQVIKEKGLSKMMIVTDKGLTGLNLLDGLYEGLKADGIDYALRVLQKDIKFTYQRDDENQIIYIE